MHCCYHHRLGGGAAQLKVRFITMRKVLAFIMITLKTIEVNKVWWTTDASAARGEARLGSSGDDAAASKPSD